jgi:riboflavin biosynthesis pyrimidine reductase
VRLLVAGGAGVHGAFLDAGLADRVDDSVLVVGQLLRRA